MLNQTLVAAPIIVLYEVGLFLSWVAKPNDADYLFIKRIWGVVAWAKRRVLAVLFAPVTIPRWLYRQTARIWRR